MFPLARLVTACLFAISPDGPVPDDATRATYDQAARAAGRDAEAHLKLALWCEQNGLIDERSEQLAKTLLIDPQNRLARALLGQMRQPDGHWVPASAMPGANAAHSAARQEYEQRRLVIEDSADSHWDLALWCEEQGLTQEARAHLTRVTWLDPKRDSAWKRLGYTKTKGRWIAEGDLAAARRAQAAQDLANTTWRARLKKLKDQLNDPRKRAEAEAALGAISDSRAVPAIWSSFVATRQPNHRIAVQLLGQIDSTDSSRALAMIVLLTNDEETHRRAAESLRHRDPREFADSLIAALKDPIKFEVKHVNGPGSVGELFVNGTQVNLHRKYQTADAPVLLPGDQFAGVDAAGLPIVERDLGFANTGIFLPAYYYPAAQSSGLIQPQFVAPTPGQASGAVGALQGQAAQAGMTGLAQGLGQARAQINAQASRPDPFAALWSDPRYYHYLDAVARGDQIAATVFAEALLPSNGMPLTFGTSMDINYRAGVRLPIGELQRRAELSAMTAEERLKADVASLTAINESIAQVNNRIVPLLSEMSGLDPATDRKGWSAWLIDQLGFRILPQRDSRPETVVEVIPPEYIPAPVQPFNSVVSYTRASCFGASTPVHTRNGLRPIEDLRVGDVVLSFDTNTGDLNYQPVLAVHHNPPSATLNLVVNGETTVTSTYHRFWSPGQGWKTARELRPGDTIRQLGGVTTIDECDPGQTQLVYNLDVAGGHTFFVGKSALLVHDNTLPQLRDTPFDVIANANSAGPAAGELPGVSSQ